MVYPTAKAKQLLSAVVYEKKKKDGLLRHNRPRRDVSILFLLYGLHPALSVIYGTDYWKPPATTDSQEENTQRFKILLSSARRREPMLRWPSDDLTLNDIRNTTVVKLGKIDDMPSQIEWLFPVTITDGMVFRREECELF